MVPTQQICHILAIRRTFSLLRNSTTLLPIPPVVRHTNGTTRNVQTTPERRQSHAFAFNTLMGAPHIPHNRRMIYFSSSSSTAMSEDEIQRRIEVYKDLYVVARDCMEELISSQVDDENENDDDDDDEFLKDVAFLQDAVLAAQKEYHNLIDDLNENTEQQDRFVRSHGIKLKRLEMELAMLQLNANVDNDDDNDNVDNYDEDDDDDDDEDHDHRGK